jgi:hypothetical protein
MPPIVPINTIQSMVSMLLVVVAENDKKNDDGY